MNSQNDIPVPVVAEEALVPVEGHLNAMTTIPPSKMFLIKQNLKTFQEHHPGEEVFDASQGDGGASLPGVPGEILDAAQALQQTRGTSYDLPFGTQAFRKAVVEDYWGLNPSTGLGPENVIATVGGRDALVKAYQAMLASGHGRLGDFVVVSRVPWISYNWGPYGVGANVLRAPGCSEEGWAYSEEGLHACVEFAGKSGRRIAGLVITSPDNPTGHTLPPERQVALGKAALRLGIPFVLYDWMYHFVTDEQPMDINGFIDAFEPEERQSLMILDGLTKSLGASNIRNAHLIASRPVIQRIVALASHTVIPSYYSMAVAMAAYRMGYREATRKIVQPTNKSREVLRRFLDEQGLSYIMGKGYYAFVNVERWLTAKGLSDSEVLGQYLAENHGLAIVPGAFFSPDGGRWIRFSYATPQERTLGAARRLMEGLNELVA